MCTQARYEFGQCLQNLTQNENIHSLSICEYRFSTVYNSNWKREGEGEEHCHLLSCCAVCRKVRHSLPFFHQCHSENSLYKPKYMKVVNTYRLKHCFIHFLHSTLYFFSHSIEFYFKFGNVNKSGSQDRCCLIQSADFRWDQNERKSRVSKLYHCVCFTFPLSCSVHSARSHIYIICDALLCLMRFM